MALTKTASDNHVTSVSVIDSSEDLPEFKMGVNQKDMWVIIDRMTELYNNAILATTREVISNHIDATVAVERSKRKPIKISTPNIFNPYFVTEDFGVGMSLEVIENNYANFGNSLKRSDFTQIGSYGFGAKAPLAYCPAFFLRTTQDGVTIEAEVRRVADGNSVKIVSMEHTGEVNGTKITIPVAEKDVAEFERYAKVYESFVSDDYELEINGKLITQNNDNYILFDNFCLDEEEDVWGRVWIRKTFLLNGYLSCLQYYYTDIKFNFLLSGWLYDEKDSRYAETDFIVEIKPGVLNFSSSRDSIKFDNRYEALYDRLMQTYSENTEANLMKIIQSYKKLDEKNAFKFVVQMVTNHNFKIQQNHHVEYTVSNYNYDIRKNNPTRVHLNTDDFTLDCGYNPMDFYTKKFDKTLYAAVKMGSNAEPMAVRCYSDVADSTALTPNNVKLICHDLNTIHERGAVLKQIVEKSVTTSVTDFININFLVNADILVIYGVDTEFMTSFIANRRSLETHGYQNQHIMFTSEKLEDTYLELVSPLATHIEQISAQDFTAKINDVKAQVRKERAEKAKLNTKSDPTTVVAYVYADKADTEAKFLTSGVSPSMVKLDLNELKQNEDVLLIVKTNPGYSSRYEVKYHNVVDNVIYGVLNREENIAGKTIYVTSDKDLVAADYNTLKDYKFVYLSQDAHYKCVAFEKLQKTQIRSDKFLYSSLRDLSKPKIMGMLFNAHFHTYISNLKNLVEFLPEDNVYRDVIETMDTHSPYFNAETLSHPLIHTIIMEKLDNDEYNAIVSLAKTCWKLYSTSQVFKLVYTKPHFSNSEDKNDVLLQMIKKQIVEIILNEK